MISLVIPFVDQYDVLLPAIAAAVRNAAGDFEFVLIDNGSEEPREFNREVRVVRNVTNVGVVQSFKQGYDETHGTIVFFIHSDVLIHELGWEDKLLKAFQDDPKLGLAGLFGARGIGTDGGRMDCYSNMLGKEWGKCKCHPVAGNHHGAIVHEVTPVTVLDGVGMAFRRETLGRLISETDMFDDWRSPHHAYDKILSLKTIQLGYHVAVVPLGFDHFSGATAVRSDRYRETAREWLKIHGHTVTDKAQPDQDIYNVAHRQMFHEYLQYWPITVDRDYNYFSRGVKWPN